MDLDSHEERVLRLVADARVRAILSILEDSAGSLGVDELAERLVEHDATSDSGRRADPEQVRVSLHHHHLPKLADAGLLAYDPEDNVVRQDGAGIAAEWLDGELIDELLGRFRGGDDGNAVGMLEGRENVIERGREIVDGADEELFLMYVTDDLLEDDCIEHARAAIERGVDVYLGSQNPNVRDLTRKHLPGATIWEPQLDWMNVPSRYPKVGCFVFADRETIMLAILEEEPDGTRTEQAVTGAGADNPLVVLVRELLGPRLDHLDYQSEEFRGELPF